MATVVSMKALLESGVHFGHRTNKWNPHMRPYIFTERNGIHIIDLQQTVKSLTTAYNLVRDAVAAGGMVLFVGTKRQAQETVQEEAVRCGMPYVTERWLGGMLTNWVTMHQRIQELERLEKLRDTGEINRLTKKEGLLIEREINRLLIRLSGVRSMKKLPELLFVVDVVREETAVHEANLTDVPVIALVDTNCDPSGVDYVIPSNDDAIRAIKLLVGKIADAVLEGKAMRKEEAEAVAEEEALILATPTPMPSGRPRYELDVDLEDKDLLGEATLAKITSTRREAAPAPAVEVVPQEAEAELPAEKTEEPAPAAVEAESEPASEETAAPQAETSVTEPETVEESAQAEADAEPKAEEKATPTAEEE